jgi:hypothetical protein
MGQIFTGITHLRQNLEFVLRVITYVTAALITCKCMEVLYIQNMKILIYNQLYNTKIFIFPAGGEWQKISVILLQAVTHITHFQKVEDMCILIVMTTSIERR